MRAIFLPERTNLPHKTALAPRTKGHKKHRDISSSATQTQHVITGPAPALLLTPSAESMRRRLRSRGRLTSTPVRSRSTSVKIPATVFASTSSRACVVCARQSVSQSPTRKQNTFARPTQNAPTFTVRLSSTRYDRWASIDRANVPVATTIRTHTTQPSGEAHSPSAGRGGATPRQYPTPKGCLCVFVLMCRVSLNRLRRVSRGWRR